MPTRNKKEVSCTIKLGFSVAKRLMYLPGPCQRLHGYYHVIEASFVPKTSLKNYMVADYVELRKRLNQWLEQNWDHQVILNAGDKKLGAAIQSITGQKVFYLQGEPTTEHLALHLKNEVIPKIFKTLPVRCAKLRLYDNDEAWVEV